MTRNSLLRGPADAPATPGGAQGCPGARHEQRLSSQGEFADDSGITFQCGCPDKATSELLWALLRRSPHAPHVHQAEKTSLLGTGSQGRGGWQWLEAPDKRQMQQALDPRGAGSCSGSRRPQKTGELVPASSPLGTATHTPVLSTMNHPEAEGLACLCKVGLAQHRVCSRWPQAPGTLVRGVEGGTASAHHTHAAGSGRSGHPGSAGATLRA